MKQWRHYTVLVRRLGGWWMPDDTEGNQEHYESREEALYRADTLFGLGIEPEVQVKETVTKIVTWLGRREQG